MLRRLMGQASSGPRHVRGSPAGAVIRAAVAWLAAIACLGPPAAAAPDDDAMSLGEAVTKALSEGVEARIARLEADRADHAFLEARSGYLPQVGVTSEAGWSNRYDEKLIALDGNGNPREYGLATLGGDRAWLNLTVSQMLLDLKQWREIEREQLAAEVAQVAETRDRDEIAYEVTRRYARLVALERKAELARQQLEQARQLDEQAQHLRDAGRALAVERDLVGLHLTDAELVARDLDNEIKGARADLWLAVGEPEPLRVPLDPESLPQVDPRAAGYGAVEAVEEAPELRILDLKRRMEEASVAAAKAGRLPTMRFVSGYSNYGPKRYDAYEDELWVGVDVEVPIFDGFRSGHAIAGAERRAEIARLRQQSTLNQKRATVREMVRSLETGDERVTLARERAAAAAEQVRLANLNLRAERGTLEQAVEASERHSRLAFAAVDQELAQTERWADLQRELGRLTFQILGPVASVAPAPTP